MYTDIINDSAGKVSQRVQPGIKDSAVKAAGVVWNFTVNQRGGKNETEIVAIDVCCRTFFDLCGKPVE